MELGGRRNRFAGPRAGQLRAVRLGRPRPSATPPTPRLVESIRGSDGIHLVAEFAEAAKLVDQGAAANAEGLGGFSAVEFMFAKGLENGLSFDLSQLLGIGRLRRGRGLGSGAQPGGQVFG